MGPREDWSLWWFVSGCRVRIIVVKEEPDGRG